MKTVQEWLGHATYNITADDYSHLYFRSKMASADMISKLLNGNNQNGGAENNGIVERRMIQWTKNAAAGRTIPEQILKFHRKR